MKNLEGTVQRAAPRGLRKRLQPDGVPQIPLQDGTLQTLLEAGAPLNHPDPHLAHLDRCADASTFSLFHNQVA